MQLTLFFPKCQILKIHNVDDRCRFSISGTEIDELNGVVELGIILDNNSTHVLPVVDYARVLYHPYSAENSELVESIQKHFTKRIPQFFNSGLTYRNRLVVLGLDSL